MSANYPVMIIDPQWRTEAEHMGSKNKFWFRNPQDKDKRDWLFKLPTEKTGEHWAEKIACEIARKMNILTPLVELAICGRDKGSASLSFTSIKSGARVVVYELLHGNQILARQDGTYNPEQRFGQRMHTIERIFDSVDIFRSETFAEQCREKMAEYFLLDAVIGNVDRHHENWGILRRRRREIWRARLAPTFDHASSLGRELLDAGSARSRESYLEFLGISKYVERGHGGVFINEVDKQAPPPLGLIGWCLRHRSYRKFFEKALRKLDYLTPATVKDIASRIPSGWMNSSARAFAITLVQYNLSELRRLQ